jgi:hypothetical protein
MKTTISIIAVLVLVGFGWMIYGDKKGTTNPATSPTMTKSIVLYTEHGGVTYKTPDQTTFASTTQEQTIISTMTIVRTDATGKASVLLPNNSMIDVGVNTEITINYTPSSTSIYQSFGNTYHRVQALLTGESYTVQTPGTLAAVRGTKFSVVVDAKTKKTRVSVTEHKVNVKKIEQTFDPTTSTSTSGGTDVGMDQTATVNYGGGTSTGTNVSVTSTDKETDLKLWLDDNRIKDAGYDNMSENLNQQERQEAIKEFMQHRLDTIRDTMKESSDKQTDTKTDTTVQTKTDTPVVTTKTTTTVKTNTTVTVPKTALTEDQFYDQFNALFVKSFYVDDDNTICSQGSAVANMKIVIEFSKVNGRPIEQANTLLSFAQAIDAYCASPRDAKARQQLQTRFDIEFPYKEDLQ